MKVNAVFQGGGMKALGLVGAVKAAEDSGVVIDRVAGTSAGAMIASFLAAGYTGEDMKEMILDTPFSSFLKRSGWHRLWGVGPAVRLFLKKGLYSGEALETWVRRKLADKKVRTFGDLPDKKLRVVASDITSGKLLVLPDDVGDYGWEPDRFDIAKAVRMSASLPFFFDPVIMRTSFSITGAASFPSQFVYIVDGGVLSNFPLWLFDRDVIDARHRQAAGGKRGEAPAWASEPMTPTLGFSLVGRNKAAPHRIIGPLSMFQALFETMMEAHDQRYIEAHNDFRTVKIPADGVGTTEFHMSKEKSLALYEAGLLAGRKFFEKKWSLPAYLEQYEKYVMPTKA